MLPAVIVGAWTAWYLGLRAGIIAAAAIAVALFAAQIVPGATITIYALVLAWCAALYFVFPKLGGTIVNKSSDSLKMQASVAWSWLKKTLQR